MPHRNRTCITHPTLTEPLPHFTCYYWPPRGFQTGLFSGVFNAPTGQSKPWAIFDGIDEDGNAAEVLQHSGHASMECIANGIGDDGFAILGAEDKVNVKAGERFGPPFQGFGLCFDLPPRALPWAGIGCPFGAKKNVRLGATIALGSRPQDMGRGKHC